MTHVIGLRELDPAGDRAALERLWDVALGDVWPLLPAGLDMVRHGLVATDAGAVVGVVAVAPGEDRGADPGDGREGAVQLLLVDPAARGRGVGSRLLEAGLARLRAAGVTSARLGGGGADYLWPGVPEDLPAAAGFFAARGWRFEGSVIDLVADLTRYRAPAGMGERAARAGTSLEVLAGPDRDEALAFEAATFPSWLGWFRRGDAAVLAARDRAGAIVGTLLFRGPPDATVYTPLLGPDAGTIGCVGVVAAARGSGVGSAMVVRASELLRDAGTGTCHIGWVERERFYTRCGYRPWRRYHMARRDLAG
jgi:ribosomal protein S18 acetylase RimI-like enzyme